MILKINIPDDRVSDLVDSECYWNMYRDMIPNPEYDDTEDDSPENPMLINNPKTREQFAKEHIPIILLNRMVKYKRIIRKSQTDSETQAEVDGINITIE
jgi:hypothetical protein